ncbi:MAG: SIS domain-containing protein [Clostridia bacterium]|nr:SIS domain-containing protein [Clostridia bacterium]
MKNYENKMQMYYEMQSCALTNTAQQGDDMFRRIRSSLPPDRPRRVVLLGIGSSFHSARLAESEFRAISGLPVSCLTPEAALCVLSEFSENTPVIAVSQSGTSTNTLFAIREISRTGAPVFAVTQGLDSPIAGEAGTVVPMYIPWETAGPKTMGVMASVCSLLLIASSLSEKQDAWEELKADMTKEAGAMAENLPVVRDWVLSLAQPLSRETAWMVTGQRAASAAAGECALKLTETVRRTAVSYELEEAVHGPCASFIARPALMCLSLPWEDEKRPEALCGACEAKGGHAYRIGLTKGAPGTDGMRVELTYGTRRLSLLQLLLPAQAVSAWIPPRMGIDLDRKEDDPFSAVLAGHLEP